MVLATEDYAERDSVAIAHCLPRDLSGPLGLAPCGAALCDSKSKNRARPPTTSTQAKHLALPCI
eukprot:992212-Amphidinium_carterae.1